MNQDKLESMSRILVIGYGNPLRGDDGFGVYVAEKLRREVVEDQVTLMTRHLLTPELAEDLSETEFVIIIAVSSSAPYGAQICRRIRPELSVMQSFASGMSPEVLLSCTQAVYDHLPQCLLVEVGSSRFDQGAGLSPEIAGLVEPAAEVVQAIIRHITLTGMLPPNIL